MQEINCWWMFFHRWSVWVDTTNNIVQRRKCDKCGKAQERYI